MRDVSNIYATIGYTRIQERSSSGPSGPWTVRREDSFSLPNVPLVKRARGDLVQSDGFQPTYYRAWDMEVTPGSVNFVTEPTIGYRYGTPYWQRYRYQGSWYPDVYSLMLVEEWPDVSEALKDRVRTQLLQDLVDQKVNLANNLGEIRQNAAMMVSTTVRLGRALLAFKRRDWREVRRQLGLDPTRVVDTARDQWLAYKFGWRPLMTDLWNLRGAILSALEEERAEMSVYRNIKQPVNTYWQNTNYLFEKEIEEGVQAKYWFRVDDETLQGLNALGFANPLSVAWELAPYSFVVDWFFGVSNFLSGLSAPLGLTLTRGYETYYIKGDIRVSDPDLEGMTPARSKVFNFQRVPQHLFPRPAPRIRLGLDSNQGLTSVALITQRL